jgi:hypothetical protein
MLGFPHEAGQRDARVEYHVRISLGRVNQPVDIQDGVFQHHPQHLRVEGIGVEPELGGELPAVADDGIEAAVRHNFGLIVERLAQIAVVGRIAVPELHCLGRIDVGRPPAEPHIEIDRVAVDLEVRLLDVVDIGADNHFGPRAGGRGLSVRHQWAG